MKGYSEAQMMEAVHVAAPFVVVQVWYTVFK
jgi:hypothetical protein